MVWVGRSRLNGERSARRQGQPNGSKLGAHRGYLLGLVEATGDITLKEMQVRLREERGVAARIGTLWRVFKGQDYTVKKTADAAEQNRDDVLVRRAAWLEGQLDLDPDRLVLIDETGASTKMTRTRGRAPRGARLRAGVPQGQV